ncbi:proline dehydrogenase [Psychroflexus gondwanensis]|jgi:proline dehydrogenase|uniref:proline dehydrogenase family protein n=1 Tax=Psychroflexus gondwanensis TaxID=251 RepID=UPI0011BEB190|nr:proline dehydrogenase family protein [Psychroflexus gondwanensis]TXE20845.1 proline dehydrogenase [Psychroflexus gondwanensis]
MIDTKIFNDTKHAFVLKSDKDLKRSLFLFTMMNIPFFVPISTRATNLALDLKLPIEGLVRATIFEQFCGGESQDECMPLVKKMYTENVYSVLDYSVEGKETEEEFDKAANAKIEIIEYASKSKEIPFAVAKPSGLGRFAIWEKVTANDVLSGEEQQEWDSIKARFERVCQAAYDNDTKLLIDAEETWMQDAADNLAEDMMRKFNKEKAIIFNTLQCYRWDRLSYAKAIHDRAQKDGFKVGFKTVRGAYMEKENSRAKKKGYPTPICEDKEATDVNFNAVMCFCIDKIDQISQFIGTHNEVSTYMALQLMSQKEISLSDDRIWFGQLYGMSDHISFNIGRINSNAIKLIPFGPINDVIPYLIRRAQENSSVQGQTSRELSLLREEKQRRDGQFVKRVE